MEKKIKKVVTDNPQNNIEALLNFAHDKDGDVKLAYADGEEEKDLAEYVAKLATEDGCKASRDDVMDGQCLFGCDCEIAVLNNCAIQAAELRERLRKYEQRLEENTLLELPYKVGEEVYVVRKNRKLNWVISKTKIEMYLFHHKLLAKCSCSSEWIELEYICPDKKTATVKLIDVTEGTDE